MGNPDEIPFNTCLDWMYKSYLIPRKNILTFTCVALIRKFIILILCVAGSFMHFVKIKKENIKEIDGTADVVVVLAGLGLIIAMSVTSYLHKEIKIFLKNIMDLSYGKPQNIDKQIKFGNHVARYLGYCCIGATVVYGIIFMIKHPNCNNINEKRDLHLICDTLMPLWFPFDVPKKSYRYVISLIQIAVLLSSACPGPITSFLIYEVTEILGLHIEHLNDHFRKIICKTDVRYRSDGLGYWVRYHNHIIKLATTLRILLKKSTGTVQMMCALVLGCAEAQLVKGEKPLFAVFIILSWLLPTFLLCHSGERLINFSLSVHDTVRDSDWYKASPSVQRDLVLILIRSQKPLCLNTIPTGVLNYSFFLLLLRASYSYMTLLNQTI